MDLSYEDITVGTTCELKGNIYDQRKCVLTVVDFDEDTDWVEVVWFNSNWELQRVRFPIRALKFV